MYSHHHHGSSEDDSFSPTDFSNLELWLDAADGDTITESGGALSQWDDKSGNVRHATQGTGALQPIYTTGLLNGLPGIVFDDSDDFMALASQPIIGTTARTLFFVARSDTQSALSPFMALTDDLTGSGGAYDISAEIAVRVDGGNAIYANDDMSSASILTLLNEASEDVEETVAYLNGALLIQSSANAIAIDTNTGNALLGITSSTNNTLDGALHEIIIYSKLLSEIERVTVHNYLSSRWGITLT